MFPREYEAAAIVFCKAKLADKTLEEGKRCAIQDNAGKGQVRIAFHRLRVAMTLKGWLSPHPQFWLRQ